MNHFHLSCTNVLCVRKERQECLEWYLSPPPLFICLLCTDCLCLHGTCARCCSCHNYHNLKLVTQYNLWPEAACCSFWYLQHRYYCQKRNKSNTLLQHVEIVDCIVKTKLFDRHFEPAVSRPECQLLVSDCLQFRADQSCENAAAAAEMFQQCS